MLRIGFGLVIGLTLAAMASTARAENEWDDFWDSVKVDWHRNNAWPHPFLEADIAAANAPFAMMIANGWQRENLLGEEYFDAETKRLTAAGRNRIRTILLQSPPEHRVIFVERDLTDEVTAKRLRHGSADRGSTTTTGIVARRARVEYGAFVPFGGTRQRGAKELRQFGSDGAALRRRQRGWRFVGGRRSPGWRRRSGGGSN